MPIVEDIINKDLTEDSPYYENNIRSKMPGYNLIMRFPTCPIPEERILTFPAYIKNITDTFTPSYDPKSVYGRMDPIPVYQRTTRAISFDLDLPSNGLAHSREIANKLNILVRNVYPTYEKNGSVNVISSPPLVRIFFSSFIANKAGNLDLLGYFTSPISIKHDLSNGVFTRNSGYESYAKFYSLNFSFTVLHEYTPGYVNTNGKATSEVNILRNLR